MKFLRNFLKNFRGEGQSNEEIADLLVRFVGGTSDDPWEFDDFASCSQRPEIEPFRREINAMRDDYPPNRPRQYCNDRGMARILEISEEIRALDADVRRRGP